MKVLHKVTGKRENEAIFSQIKRVEQVLSCNLSYVPEHAKSPSGGGIIGLVEARESEPLSEIASKGLLRVQPAMVIPLPTRSQAILSGQVV